MRKGAMLAALMIVFGLAGCAATATDSDLANRVSALEQAVAGAQTSADSAQNTANRALEAAGSAQACCAANSEKMNRMFEKASSK